MSEFNWWMLIVGLVIGAGLVWLVLSDSQRRESAAADAELTAESDWIADTLAEAGQPIDATSIEQVLRLHRTWLASLPPDDDDGWTEPRATDDTTPEDAADPERADAASREDPVALERAPLESQPRGDESAGTTPVWSATDPSPRRR